MLRTVQRLVLARVTSGSTLRTLQTLVLALVVALATASSAAAFAPESALRAHHNFSQTRVGPLTTQPPEAHQQNTLGYGEVASDASLAAEGAAPVAEGAFSRVVGFTERNLQKGFSKHGADFGLGGNWNPSRAAEFSRAVNQQINAAGVEAIEGTYRGASVTHLLNPSTGLNVIVDGAGNFVSGWRLGAEQLQSDLSTGRLF